MNRMITLLAYFTYFLWITPVSSKQTLMNRMHRFYQPRSPVCLFHFYVLQLFYFVSFLLISKQLQQVLKFQLHKLLLLKMSNHLSITIYHMFCCKLLALVLLYLLTSYSHIALLKVNLL